MKIIWKGKYSNVKQLSIGNLPNNAVKFKEPSNFFMINLVASIFVIPVFIIIGIVFYIKKQLGLTVDFWDNFNAWGMVAAYIMILFHEFLHAVAYPKEAEVQIWYSVKNLTVFAFCTYPTSKLRFIYICLLPSIILGFIPLIAWIFIPEFSQTAKIIFTFAFFNLTLSIGDFLNAYNAAIQMPRNSATQISGFHSYWYVQ